MKRNPRIAVIGGGPGGLTLARILQTRGISCTVFEGETSALARPQGGTLDLHPESGQHALRLAGLETQFLNVARYEDQGVKLCDPNGNVIFSEPSKPEDDRPEVDRTALRQILLDSLEPGVVKWGHKLQVVEPRADGAYDVVFQNGVRENFDLVVGADGTWSKVRPLVSDAKPVYSGVTFIDLSIDNVDELYPQISELIGRGKMFALGNNKGLLCQRNGNAHIRVYAAVRVPEDWIATGGLDLSAPDRTRADVWSLFDGWAPNLLELIDYSNDLIVPRQIHALPVGHRWENRPGITLIGDAAHVMSPFSGEGANLAMIDGADLALALIEGSDWKVAVERFEKKMLPRAAEAAVGAAEGIDGAISERGLEDVVVQFQRHASEVER
ncbi:FAD-dependent monooxygenase [bacterium]|nr:MAG: FAD-dependent monooxygenase [bacterium]